ncbi:MAG: hypothetical protein ACI4I7_04525 [Oscillospiraceae bacterium]
MSKICKSCGNYYDGEYCTNCGYGNKKIKVKSVEKYKKATNRKQSANDSIYAPQNKNSAEKAGKTTSKNILIILIVIAVAVIAAGLIKSGVFSTEEKTDVINNYFQAINERDFDKYIKCFPSEMKEDYENDRETLNCSKEEYMNKFAEEFEKDYGKGFSITAVCGKEKKLNDYSMEEYKEAYGTVPSISEAYVVSVTVDIKGPEKFEQAHMECYVGKIRSKWKLFNIEQVAGTVTEDSLSSST